MTSWTAPPVVSIKEHIFEFQVPVDDLLAMDVVHLFAAGLGTPSTAKRVLGFMAGSSSATSNKKLQ